MSQFPWKGRVRAFGIEFQPDAIPWWYLYGWIPVVFHPLAFLVLFGGIVTFWVRWTKKSGSILSGLSLKASSVADVLTLENWIFIFTLIPLAAFHLAGPRLYDEERHFLFWYPPLALLAAFGLDSFQEKLKWVGSAILVGVALISIHQWGRYSYIYKSPLIGDRSSSQFMGDYWGVCVSEGIRALPSDVPKGSVVVVIDLEHIAKLQASRLSQGPFSQLSEFGPYSFVAKPVLGVPNYILVYNRMDIDSSLLRDVRNGVAKKVWEQRLPTGEAACTLILYHRIERFSSS